MKKIIEMLSDGAGTLSTMRVMSFVALGVAIGITVHSLVTHASSTDTLLVWIVAAFAPKAIQKFAERGK